ncbi:zinc ABC transporter substrate-binding protein [Undibacterium sp. BYS107W]|uniref:Zinc ABC transporter substrate-binding protein n=1 Tax=Undibacterium baiyunense TaxID=2828731 RepID=A0A941DDR1_9BURK|nr:zinc ABC transporter substrate-binding protein [Undibacterium baiyunense]
MEWITSQNGQYNYKPYLVLERTVHILFKLKTVLPIAVISSAFIANAGAQTTTVFACEPEWAALTRVLLPNASIHVATHSKQDPHHIEARPALIAQLRSADVAVCTGGELESAWLPMLQQRAGNSKVQNGAQGMFFASEQVEMIDPRPGVLGTPFSGDVHAEGNPHFHTDPHRFLKVAQALSKRFATLFPQEASAINQRTQAFSQMWSQQVQQWEKRAATLKGMRVASQHTSFAYLWRWLGIEQISDLEPKPGMAPTPAHLQRQLSLLQATPVEAVVVAAYQDPRAAKWLTSQTGIQAPLLILPATTENPLASDALVTWFDQLVNSLLKVKVK